MRDAIHVFNIIALTLFGWISKGFYWLSYGIGHAFTDYLKRTITVIAIIVYLILFVEFMRYL